MLLGTVKLLKSPDNLPDVWTACYRSLPVMGRFEKLFVWWIERANTSERVIV